MRAGPQTRPVFFGDDWWELRDAQFDARLETIDRLAGRVGDFYLRAATVAGQADDPLARALRRGRFVDLTGLEDAHTHLAGHWRLTCGHLHPTLPGMCDIHRTVRDWRDWAMREATLWIIEQPILVRRFAAVIAFSRTDEGAFYRRELQEALMDHYAISRPAQGDFFDDPARYTPYR